MIRRSSEQASDFATGQWLRQEALDLFKHWDSIRWQGPAWLSAAAAVIGSIMSSNPSNTWNVLVENPLFIGLCLVLTTFGTICAILQVNLIRYHSSVVDDYERAIGSLNVSVEQSAFLMRRLPFSFKGRELWNTASAWLLLYTGALAAAFAIPALIGVLHRAGAGSWTDAIVGFLVVAAVIALLLVKVLWALSRLPRK